MRYFPNNKAAIKNDNARKYDAEADKKFLAAFKRGIRAYHNHLDKIAGRLGPGAYRFFRFGFEEAGLHDGFLLDFSMGDAIDSVEKALSKLRFGSGKSIIRMRVLSYMQDTEHTFEFGKLRRVLVDIPSTEPLWFKVGGTLGQIYSYEIVAASPKYLRIEWLLDSGGTILIEFEKLHYRFRSLIKDKRKL
jgi:hypothetical protein